MANVKGLIQTPGTDATLAKAREAARRLISVLEGYEKIATDEITAARLMVAKNWAVLPAPGSSPNAPGPTEWGELFSPEHETAGSLLMLRSHCEKFLKETTNG